MSTENQNSTVGRLMDEEVIDLRQLLAHPDA